MPERFIESGGALTAPPGPFSDRAHGE